MGKRTKHNMDGISTSQIESLIEQWIYSRRDRELLKLKFLDGLSYEEVAGIIDLSVTQTKTIAYRAVNIMRQHCIESI